MLGVFWRCGGYAVGWWRTGLGVWARGDMGFWVSVVYTRTARRWGSKVFGLYSVPVRALDGVEWMSRKTNDMARDLTVFFVSAVGSG